MMAVKLLTIRTYFEVLSFFRSNIKRVAIAGLMVGAYLLGMRSIQPVNDYLVVLTACPNREIITRAETIVWGQASKLVFICKE